MAEAVVSVAVEQLLLLLKEEVNFLIGIHKDFDSVRKEFVSIQAFLKDADRKTVANGDIKEGVKIWVKDVIEAAFCIEDIIDEYMIYARQQPRDPGCVTPLKKIAHLIKTLILVHRIASEIKEIKSDVRGIKERSDRYGLQTQDLINQGSSRNMESQNVEWHDPRYIEEAELVGFESPRDELVGRLVQGPVERNVVAVIGMGGLGKTTIAKKTLDSKRVVEHFDCHVWITVSQSYSIKWLLKEMLQKLFKESKHSPPEDIDKMDQESLANAVRDYLQQKRYVVVFDDVWDEQFWRGIEFALLDNKLGSRIIITTRKKDVARFCERNSCFVHVHKLQRLTIEKSQELLYKKAFKSDFNNGCCPEDLREISCKILTKCDGLPLAIVVIGGLLSSKEKTKMEWERFNQSLSLELENDPELNNITKILGFSYDDLPYFLKPCLLYFAMYPEDYEVKLERLIRQWVAEGFVRFAKEKTLEEVAEAYLRELIDRSLVQVSSCTIDGKVKRCRVHDLLREMILIKSKDLSFCQFIGEDDRPISNGIIRRLSVATSKSREIIIESSHVRSLLFFHIGRIEYDTYHFERRIFRKNRLWKVLDFEDYFPWGAFSRNLGNLIHLKYLGLRGPFQSFTKPIGKLQNLETLMLRTSGTIIFPKETSQVKTLRHIVAKDKDEDDDYGELCFIEGKDYIGGMTCLQTLRNVSIRGDEELITELAKLRQMRNLGLTNVGKEAEGSLCCLNAMQHLEKLFIGQPRRGGYSEILDLNSSISLSFPKLRKLHLSLNIIKLPEWVPKLQSLTKLILQRTRLIEDPAESLVQNMPNLLYLHIISYAYEGESLHFQDGGFQKLQELELRVLDNLNSIIIDEGALQSLRKLLLRKLPRLKTAPSGINHLKKLQLIHTNLPIQLHPQDEQDHRIKIIRESF